MKEKNDLVREKLERARRTAVLTALNTASLAGRRRHGIQWKGVAGAFPAPPTTSQSITAVN